MHVSDFNSNVSMKNKMLPKGLPMPVKLGDKQNTTTVNRRGVGGGGGGYRGGDRGRVVFVVGGMNHSRGSNGAGSPLSILAFFAYLFFSIFLNI